jgi:hypothetical protein
MKSRIETKDGDMLSPIMREEIALSHRQILLIQARAALLREEKERANRVPLYLDSESEDNPTPPWWLILCPLAGIAILLGIIFSAGWWLK